MSIKFSGHRYCVVKLSNDEYAVRRETIFTYKNWFSKEILMTCNDEVHMNLMERQIVTEIIGKDKNCYNLCIGGEGGWTHWNILPDAQLARSKGGKKSGISEWFNSKYLKEKQDHYNKGLGEWMKIIIIFIEESILKKNVLYCQIQ